MRREWLMQVREDQVIGCEKGKGDKEWRQQKWEDGIIYQKISSLKMLSHWKTKAADQLSFSFCLFLTATLRRTACPHPGATVTTKHALTHTHNPREQSMHRGGRGIVLLLSYSVVS